MKPDSRDHRQEIELKLALPASDPGQLEKLLARTPALARRQPGHILLHNVYYDTPDQILRKKKIALRLRRVGSAPKARWLQTLKTGGSGDSALSQRGEWETAFTGNELDLRALQATPWSEIDLDGAIFKALAPCFVTTFERTFWTVRKRDGSIVEVSLDIGQIGVGDQSTHLCELELELIAGPPSALFALARQIAVSVCVLPEHRSKAERGYALAQNCLTLALHAQPPPLAAKLRPTGAAQRVLREMFCQFTANLNALRFSDDPEVVHQARVGWRRFRSACRLFRRVRGMDAQPSAQPLTTLLAFMGELRDLDVAQTETLPGLATAYIEGKPGREKNWREMEQALVQATRVQRKATRYALAAPAVGATLLEITQWLESLAETHQTDDPGEDEAASLRHWARVRVSRFHRQLKRALKDADTSERQHRVRILAKRLRYAIEALGPLVQKRRAQRWLQQAIALQTDMGKARDVAQASVVLEKLEAAPALVEFLRGVALGQQKT